ncbi:MAG TPA: preprotein translocase subunit SecA [Candidatus Paceibacterota bacterium]|nr:preprotein translocase subunit SecA [Candidatus Paceibacterota bacterium]HMP19083.1 preprotein translocase subunit SecA [Candidatus Paceibacterota bacterium]HMP85475.1 preprotein translocase subunit SecA [Candidatus Paceibacterota bacterium]
MSFFSKFFGDENSRLLKKYQNKLLEINSFTEDISKLSDEQLKEKTFYFKKKLAEGSSLEEILPEVFAVVREVSTRTLGERHYDVQLIGGMVIHDGNIAEMRTGEGKTLVATLPAYLNALSGRGVHVVTVNDFLARRDVAWMGQIYHALGLSVSVINQDNSYIYDPSHTDTEKDKERDEKGSYHIVYDYLRPISRKEAYDADITYGTNSEFGFDYLRDNIEYETSRLRQREFNFAIVDEIDSILIDEARTPLIISAPSTEAENLYEVFADISKKMIPNEDYTVDEKLKAISLTDKGIEKAEKFLGVGNIYTEKGVKYVHHLETAVRAKALFYLDKHYVVRDGQVIIVDEFTGRMQPSRRWSEGLHQAIEAKEGLKTGEETRTFASITYQNYFRMYKKLSGMTGTAKTSSEEFFKVYKLETITIPTNKPIARIDHDDFIYQTEKGKFLALVKKIKEIHSTGQPILVGTVSIEKNEIISELLTRNGIPHQVLNAKNHEREAEIIAQAGKKGAVTIATNMAGRGVDIKLGGEPYEKSKADEIRSVGGLFVIGTERHEARRIDNQLRGRSGRQGDPGATQFFVSLDDDLMRVFASPTLKSMMAKLGLPEDEPIQNRIITRSLENAQTKIEGFHFDARKHILEFDSVLSSQRNSIYSRRKKILSLDKETIDNELQEIKNRGGEEISKIVAQKQQELGDEEFYKVIRRLLLQSIDTFWIDHLETMDYTRSSVNLRAYGQRDPLVEYKKEGLRLFGELKEAIYEQVIKMLPNIGAGAFIQAEERLKKSVKLAQMNSGDKNNVVNTNISHSQEKIGRNDKITMVKGDKEIQIKFKKIDEYLKDGWLKK